MIYIHASLHPSIHASIHSDIHSFFIHSDIHSFIQTFKDRILWALSLQFNGSDGGIFANIFFVSIFFVLIILTCADTTDKFEVKKGVGGGVIWGVGVIKAQSSPGSAPV